MGESNSSVTRVWPVFEYLLNRDPTGSSWLLPLIKLGSRAQSVDRAIFAKPGLLPEPVRYKPVPKTIKKAIGESLADKIKKIRSEFEADIPPTDAFLRWLLKHPKKLKWPEVNGRQRFGKRTEENRRLLVQGDARIRNEALEELAKCGASKSRRKWWAFEGFTSVDCKLETQSLLLFIEGKRTEPISSSTAWFPDRNQVIRNLEVAQAIAAGRKNFAVLVCVETDMEDLADEVWTKSLPHLSRGKIDNLKSHYLGFVRWSSIEERLCSGLKLPDKLNDAIETCLEFRR